VFIVVSALWIVLSDYLVYSMVDDTATASSISVAKGLGFIAVTSLLIYVLVNRGFRSLKSAQDSLRRSENRYRSMFESSPIAMLEVDLDGSIVRTNRKADELVGAPSTELRGRRLDSLYALEADHYDRWSDLLEGKQESFSMERRLRRTDGSSIWCNMVISMVRDQDGRPAFIVEMIEDITERKEQTARLESMVAERTLGLSQIAKKMTVTLQSIGDGVVVTDHSGEIMMLNAAAERMLEGRRSAGLREMLPMDGETLDRLMGPLSGDHVPVSGSATLPTPSGKLVVSYTSAPIKDPSGTLEGMVVVLRDDTLNVQMGEEMARARRLKAVGNLAGGLAHNLNNILTIIEGNIELAMRLCPEASTNLSDARSAAMRGRGLASRLITFARGGEPIRTNVNVRQLLEEIIAPFHRDARSNMALDVSRDTMDMFVDREQMAQALTAVIAYAGRGPHGATVSVHACNNDANGEVEVIVISRDMLLDSTTVQALLDPVFEEKGSIELDLSIANFIISRNGGQLLIEPSPGRGTAFVMRLPRARPEEEMAIPSRPKMAKVLWMEDEELIRELNLEFLSALGHEGDVARDGEEAIRLYKEAATTSHPYDLVLLDLMVPNGMGGMDAFKELRASYPGLRAIVCSGYSTDPVMSDWEKLGFAGVLPKPYNISELAKVIERAMVE